MRMQLTKGFTIVESVIVVVGAAIVVALGLAFYTASTKQNTTAETTISAEQVVVPDVKMTADLDVASQDLDQLDLEDTDDSAQLDAQETAF